MGTRVRNSTDVTLNLNRLRYDSGTLTSTTPYLTVSDSRSMTDVVVPDYRERIKRGAYVNNPCSFVRTLKYTEGAGQSLAVHKTNGSTIFHTGPGSQSGSSYASLAASQRPVIPTVPSGWDNQFHDAAMASALADVDSTPYSFAEDIAEWRETLGFLRDPLGSLKGLANTFSKDVSKLMLRRKALMRAQAVSDVYLTYRFAFSPLVRTVNNLISAYSSSPARPVRRSARGRSGSVYTTSFDQQRGSSGNFLYWRGGIERDLDVRAVIGYEVSNPVMDWRFKYGLRFKDIPETLWAIMPLSFMYDRVWNASEAIRGLTNLADPNVSILGANVTVRKTDKTWYSYYRQVHSSYNTTVSPDTEHIHVFSYVRSLWSPTVLDVVPPITWGNVVNTSLKAADLLALITQRIKV